MTPFEQSLITFAQRKVDDYLALLPTTLEELVTADRDRINFVEAQCLAIVSELVHALVYDLSKDAYEAMSRIGDIFGKGLDHHSALLEELAINTGQKDVSVKSPVKNTAKVFMTGRSQAVRLPLEFRFDGDEVFIHRDPATRDVILSQKPGNWQSFFDLVESEEIPADFLAERENAPATDKGIFE
tara:strand:- start:4345 stop:4899 length:555 start_codon:yes stop_codon:yes gene_type:complete